MSRQAGQPIASYVQNRAIEFERIDDHIFLIDPARNRIHALNAAAAAVWELLDEETSLSELVQVFHEAYPGQTRKQLTQDILVVLGNLQRIGAIEAACQ
jgi:Coenzyme PQQ synthesis protein D (PqqD)